jgi:methylenetetrahydrofolate--tRNA-(uracil-5-)-methyltransferase
VFRASRWNRSFRSASAPVACGVDDGEGDYLNCPFTRDEYERFYDALIHAESATVHDFEREEVLRGLSADRGDGQSRADTLRFGPMKPVGLVDPATGRPPYAAVQLRQDNLAGDHYSLVGFQTQLKWGEQARVLRNGSRPAAGRVRSLRRLSTATRT